VRAENALLFDKKWMWVRPFALSTEMRIIGAIIPQSMPLIGPAVSRIDAGKIALWYLYYESIP